MKEIWSQEGWPYGLKIDLARQSPIKEINDHDIIFRRFLEKSQEWIFTVSQSRPPEPGWARFYKAWFDHPAQAWPNPPRWQYKRIYSVRGDLAAYWIDGIAKLCALNVKECREYRGLFIYDIEYGGRTDFGKVGNVRFFITKRGGVYYRQIQDFYPLAYPKDYTEGSRVLCWRVTDAEYPEQLIKTLTEAQNRHYASMRAHDDCTRRHIEDGDHLLDDVGNRSVAAGTDTGGTKTTGG